MPTWPSPSSKRLGTPKIPAIRFTRGTYFGASRFTYATACQVARPPLTDRTRSPRPQRAFTSRLPAVWSPSLPLDITTTWTGLLLLAGPAPAGMAASLAAPDPTMLFYAAVLAGAFDEPTCHDAGGGCGHVDREQLGSRRRHDSDLPRAGGRRAARRLSCAGRCGLVHGAIRGQAGSARSQDREVRFDLSGAGCSAAWRDRRA